MNYKLILTLLFLNTVFWSQAQNIALNKKYELSVLPNYPYSASPNDKTSLTDGKYTSVGRFWTQATTVGWRLEDVNITIDLQRAHPIEEVRFSTIRASDAGVYFPKNIFIFLSNDRKNWTYMGDAADVVDNLPGAEQRKEFSVNNINQRARFVRIAAVRQRNFLFCDEIEVIRGKKTSANAKSYFREEAFARVIDSLQAPENNRRHFLRQVNSLKSLSSQQKLNIQNIRSESNVQNLKKEIGKLNASYLKAKFKAPLILEKVNPWADLSEFRVSSETTSNLVYDFLLPVGHVRYESFLLTNLDSFDKKVYFTAAGNSNSDIELFSVPFVTSSFYNKTPDPMVRVTDSFNLEPGRTHMFIIKILGKAKGKVSDKITFSFAQKESEIKLEGEVIGDFSIKEADKLNVNVWAYYINPMVRNIKKEVRDDLSRHYVNTMVVPPSIVPALKNDDYSKFKDYLDNLKGARKVLIYMDYSMETRRNGYKGGKFMSDDWKTAFREWYSNLLKIISNSLGMETEIYLYPYDEVNEENISNFQKFVSWAKREIPDIKFYATLNIKEAVSSILPIVNIAQILPSLTDNLPEKKGEVWIYTGNTPSRDLPPYSFYRLMAWDAFMKNYKGIGFWNYADERNGNNLNLISDRFLNLAGSYSVIYNDENGNIITSRRWEAFRSGIEDYSILQAYAQKFGIKKAKENAALVLANDQDLNMADSIKVSMMKKLIGN